MNLREMLTGDVNRLRYIHRHSTSLTLHKENVAEHSYYVSLYATFICHHVASEGLYVDELTVLKACILHDLDEARTGDFQRPFKYGHEGLKETLDEAACKEFMEMIISIFPLDQLKLVGMVDLWRNAKDQTREGAVVAFADFLSVVSYLFAETACANRSVITQYQTLIDYVDKFDHEVFDFIRPLVKDAKEIVREIVGHLKEIE